MSRRTIRLALPATLLFLTCAISAAAETQGKVTRVYDGDTLFVAGVGTVRLLGIDCPETESSPRDRYYLDRGIPQEVLRRTAKRARTFVRHHALGRQVILRFDRERADRHGRILAYLVLPDGRMLNRLLLAKGLAAVYRRFDFRLKEAFLTEEEKARRTGAGIWASPPPPEADLPFPLRMKQNGEGYPIPIIAARGTDP